MIKCSIIFVKHETKIYLSLQKDMRAVFISSKPYLYMVLVSGAWLHALKGGKNENKINYRPDICYDTVSEHFLN